MIVNMMTNNYQERQEDISTKYEELVKEFQILKMDYEEDEEMIQSLGDKVKKLEGEVRRLKSENGKLRAMKKNESEQ